jgi:hypothetical protein
MDILATNSLCLALYTDIFTPETLPVNLARLLFLDPRSNDFFVEWDTVTDDAVAALRAEAGRNPLDRNLSHLIGETRSAQPKPHPIPRGPRTSLTIGRDNNRTRSAGP